MNNKNIKDKVNEFLQNKNITNPFFQECILEYVEKHTEIFGHVITADELLGRLEKNLDRINFCEIGPEFSGRYNGRMNDNEDLNEIQIFFDPEYLNLSDDEIKNWDSYDEKKKQKRLDEIEALRNSIKSTVFHELTHAAYTIKGSYGMGSKHIFYETGKNIFGCDYYSKIGGTENYFEAIVNYISNRLNGKTKNQIMSYRQETQAIYLLAEKIEEEKIIKSAWNSDFEGLKKSYEDSIGPTFDIFDKYMVKLVENRENYTKSDEILENVQLCLDGKIVEDDKKISQIELKKLQSNEVVLEMVGKKGFKDVLESTIPMSWLHSVTKYIKNLFNKDKTNENSKTSVKSEDSIEK